MKRSPWIIQVGLNAVTNVLKREAQKDSTYRGEDHAEIEQSLE